jgi:hypothetical protein
MAGEWLLGAETHDSTDERPRAMLVAVAPDGPASEGDPGTETSLRELRPPMSASERQANWPRRSSAAPPTL